MSDLLKGYLIGTANQAAATWDRAPGTGGGGGVAALLVVLAIVGAILWGLWRLYVSLRAFTEEHTWALLVGFGVLSLLVVGLVRLLSGRNRITTDEWSLAATVGVVGGVVLPVFKFGAPLLVDGLAGNRLVSDGFWMMRLFMLVNMVLTLLVTLLVIALFLAVVAVLVVGTTYALHLSRATGPALGIGAPACWALLTWLWFVPFGHPGFLPFTNPVPGLNAIDAVLLLPFVALTVSGVLGTTLGLGVDPDDLPDQTTDESGDGESKGDPDTTSAEDGAVPAAQDSSPARELVDAATEDPVTAGENLDTLSGLLSSDDRTLRRKSAEAIRELAATEPAAVEGVSDDLVETLHDDDPVVVRNGLRALGHVADHRPTAAAPSARAVADLLDHDRPSVRSAAVVTAAAIAGHSPGPFASSIDATVTMLDVSDMEANLAAARVVRAVAEDRPDALDGVDGTLRQRLDEDLLHPDLEEDLEYALQRMDGSPT